MLTKNINFKNFYKKKNKINIKKHLKSLLEENSEVINSLKYSYKDNFLKKNIKKYKKFFHIRLIGMGGSILGAEAIYNFLKKKIKKKFTFINNLKPEINTENKKKF